MGVHTRPTTPTRGWPTGADDYVLEANDAWVDDRNAWKDRYQDDPRPNAGISCNGRYTPDDDRIPPGSCRRKYHCWYCGLRKLLQVDQSDAQRVIGFACPACRTQQPHVPVGYRPGASELEAHE